MELLQAGVDRSVIALWLGHESVETTQIYLDMNLALKEDAVKKTSPLNAESDGSSQTISCCHFCEPFKGTNYAAKNQNQTVQMPIKLPPKSCAHNACGIVRHSTLWLLCRMRHSSQTHSFIFSAVRAWAPATVCGLRKVHAKGLLGVFRRLIESNILRRVAGTRPALRRAA